MFDKKNYINFTIIFLLLLSFNSFSQTYKDDSLAIRAILDSNGMDSIPVELVTKKENDRIVSFSKGQGLTRLPSEIGKLTALKELLIDGNVLTSIPPEIGNLVELEILYLHWNNLTSLPPQIGNLKSLKRLELGFNELTDLPKEIGNLLSLVILDIHDNKLTYLPEEIGNLTALKELSLYNTELESLPPEIGNLESLQRLELDYNKLDSLPHEIGNLTLLKELRLAENSLSTLPEEIGNLVELEILDLFENELISLPNSIIQCKDLKLTNINNGLNLCDNPDLIFTDEQKGWLGVASYDDYYNQYCAVSIDKTYKKKNRYDFLNFNISGNNINFFLPEKNPVILEIFDTKGRLYKTFVNEHMERGKHIFVLNKSEYITGMYYLKLTAGENSIVKKAVLIK